jgi:homoserine kinase
VDEADKLEVVTHGCGAELPADEHHLAARIATQVQGHDRLRIEVHSEIPVGRGLGSSAALAVAAAAAAGAHDPFAYGVAVDGHPENAAAASFGGLLVATTVGVRPVWRRLALDPGLRFVVLVPDRVLLTDDARDALPPTIPHADASFNLGRMGLLIAGLADRTQLIPEAGDDRLHHDPRSRLFPEAPNLLAGLRDAGALTSCWSGAGPSLLAVCDGAAAEGVAEAARSLMAAESVDGHVRVMDADLGGIQLSAAQGQ